MIEFDGELTRDPDLGIVWQPCAELLLSCGEKRLRCRMVVDSGADISILPLQIGKTLGFELADEPILRIRGVADTVIPFVIRRVKMKVGGTEVDARVGWALIEEVPLLLGRADIFDVFRVEMDQRARKLRFHPLRPLRPAAR